MIPDNRIGALFDRVYQGQKNFITREIVRYGRQGRLLYELSEGTGFEPGTKIYGVTVLEEDGTKRNDLAQAFSLLSKAEAYIANNFRP
jgi:hypothetical protein